MCGHGIQGLEGLLRGRVDILALEQLENAQLLLAFICTPFPFLHTQTQRLWTGNTAGFCCAVLCARRLGFWRVVGLEGWGVDAVDE